MSKAPFEKFIDNSPKGAKKKEMLKVEKRKAKKEAQALGEQLRREKYEKLHGISKPTIKSKSEKRTSNKPFIDKPSNNTQTTSNPLPVVKDNTTTPDKRFSKKYVRSNSDKYFKPEDEADNKSAKSNNISTSKATVQQEALMPLNKFIAYGGISGRREAAALVKQGLVTVNGDVVYEPGYKVSQKDVVKVKGKQVFQQKNLVYILLNKPKDYLTTSADPEGRKTVLELVKNATKERVYPVGRLDRNTTGVLLLTNDGELAQKLTHPSYEIKKIYAVKLDKPLTKKDFDSIVQGINLEDGEIHADSIAYTDMNDKTQIGIEIHSGRNRIVRRIFEHLNYEVKNLDRVMFATLTKKNVERGHWRMLTDAEVRALKFLNKSFTKKEKTTT